MQNWALIVLLLVVAAGLYTLYARITSLETFAKGIHEALMQSVHVIEDEYVSSDTLKGIIPSILNKAAKFTTSHNKQFEQRLMRDGLLPNAKTTDKLESDRRETARFVDSTSKTQGSDGWSDMNEWWDGDEECEIANRHAEGISSEHCPLDSSRHCTSNESDGNHKEDREECEDCLEEDEEGVEEGEIEGIADVLSSVANIFGSLGGKHQHDVRLRAADVSSARVYVAAPPAFISTRGGLAAALGTSTRIFFDEADRGAPARLPPSATIEEMDSDEDCEAP